MEVVGDKDSRSTKAALSAAMVWSGSGRQERSLHGRSGRSAAGKEM
jgi:hypothetical protein